MRPYLLKIVLLLLLGASPAFAAETGPLKVVPPDGWKLEYNGTNGLDFYAFSSTNVDDGLMMISKWPVAMDPGDIPATLRQMTDRALKDTKGLKEITELTTNYEVVTFTGEQCKGSYTALKFISNTRTNRIVETSSLFMMTINGQMWSGYFQGTTEYWTQALDTVKNLKTAN
jgi:hypothetical protein